MSNNMNSNIINTNEESNKLQTSRKLSDAQIIVTGVLKENEHTEMIVFSISLALFELVCIVTIPSEGTTTAPVYCKFRIKK